MKNLIKNLARIITAPSTCRCMRKPEYAMDGLITNHTCNFTKNQRFIEARESALKAIGTRLKPNEVDWRLHTALWAARQCSRLEGDFAECGVAKGLFSRAIVHYINWNKLNKRFWLLDTFEGVPVEHVTKEELLINPHISKDYKTNHEKAVKTFEGFNNIRIIKGKVSDTLNQVTSEKIAYLSLDMNNAYPEIRAAEFFWNRMVKGGMMLLDDYAFHRNYAEQRKAFDKFAEEKGVGILTLATGQGLIIK